MVVLLVVYFVLSLPLYHSFWTFQFINIFPFEEHAFVLKSEVAFNELDVFIDNKNKIKRPSQYESLSLIKFNSFYNIKKKSKHCKLEIISFVNYNKHT
jgi:hypothetical protein